MVDLDATLDAFLNAPELSLLSPAALRLGRKLPDVQRVLDPLLDDPLDRALLGLEPQEGAPLVALGQADLGPADLGPADIGPTDIGPAVLAAVAALAGGGALTVQRAAALEAAARKDPLWWPLAAQVHAACSVDRERAARQRLSAQDLPYVFPGDLDPVVIDLLAAGERVMPALHVDWTRKLTTLAADALILDCRAVGLWFWPVLRSLATDRLVRPIAKLRRARRLPSGGRGLAAAYASRVGAPMQPLLDDAGPADRLLAALAVVGDRPA